MISRTKLMLSKVEHEKRFITSMRGRCSAFLKAYNFYHCLLSFLYIHQLPKGVSCKRKVFAIKYSNCFFFFFFFGVDPFRSAEKSI